MYLHLCPETHSYCSTEPFPKKRSGQPQCQGMYFRSIIIIHRFEPCGVRFSIFEKKVEFFPLKGKKLISSHFVQKIAQIIGYDQTAIGIV